MAAPTYAEDLTDITLAEATTGFSAYGGGGAGLGVGADLSMQGNLCVDKQITNADKGIYFDNGAGITLPAGAHVFVWLFNATPGLSDTIALKGASILVGTGSNAYCQYHVEGSDTYGAAGRVAKCYPVNYSVRTSNTGSTPYRTVTGNPGANPQVFGGGLNTTATVKGANLGIDAMRYGTGAYITGGDSGQPATFAGFQAQNDAVANRWGILTKVGASYELQGKFVIGQGSNKIAALAYFDDSDVNIAIVDTVHSATDFTEIIIDHASTEVYWTNVSITALATHNKGNFRIDSPAATVVINGGTWTGLNTTSLQAGASIDGLTWRQCAQVSNTNQANLSNCVFDRSTSATSLTLPNLSYATNCTFISDGSNHAVELNSIGGGSMNWNSTLSGYAAGTSASPVTPTSTGNEAIYVNVGSGTLTINVEAGATIPSIRSAGATVNVVAGQVTTTITIVDIDTGSPIQNARVYVVAGATGPLSPGTVIIDKVLTDVNGQVTDIRSLASNQSITGRVRRSSPGFGTLYKTSGIVGTISSASGLDLTIQMLKDE